MKVLGDVVEPEVVLEFLKAELSSPRFGPILRDALTAVGTDEKIITSADISDLLQNQIREKVLGQYRGWKRNLFIFNNFPSNISWHEVDLSQSDIKQLLYINYGYWIELSGGTKKVGDAAKNILDRRKGKEIMGQNNARFMSIADDINADKKLPKIILVAESLDSNITILEGHARATAYALAGKPHGLKAILGVSPDIKVWTKNNFG